MNTAGVSMLSFCFLLDKNEPTSVNALKEDVMSKKHESRWNLEELSDADIYNAILYLEPDPQCRKQHEDDIFVICLCIVILLLGLLGLMCLYYR